MPKKREDPSSTCSSPPPQGIKGFWDCSSETFEHRTTCSLTCAKGMAVQGMNKKNLATCRCPNGKDCSWNVNIKGAECKPRRTSQASAQVASPNELENTDPVAGKNCGGLSIPDERQMPLSTWICDINGFRFRYTGNDQDVTHNTKCAMKCTEDAQIINLKGPNVSSYIFLLNRFIL